MLVVPYCLSYLLMRFVLKMTFFFYQLKKSKVPAVIHLLEAISQKEKAKSSAICFVAFVSVTPNHPHPSSLTLRQEINYEADFLFNELAGAQNNTRVRLEPSEKGDKSATGFHVAMKLFRATGRRSAKGSPGARGLTHGDVRQQAEGGRKKKRRGERQIESLT